MTDTKNTESTRVETLVPQQLINDSAALVEFLKEYYNFLGQSGQPTDVINTVIRNKDLDLAIDKFISIVEKEIGYGMASNMEANKINVYKNINQFYSAKGSFDSFKLLFRLLYNVDIEISLPKEQILIASDGTWEQQNVVYSNTLSGNIFSLVNSKIFITNPDSTRIEVEVERVRFVRDDIYEITINQNFAGIILDNATITTDEYSGELISALGEFNIIQPGQNFSVGQVLEIDDGIIEGQKSLIKITSVNSSGSILNFEFIQFGTQYQSDFTSYLTPVNFNSDFEQSPSDFGFTADRLGRVFESLKANEYVNIEINPYSLNYFASDYLEGSRKAGDYDSVYNQQDSGSIDQEVITEEEIDESIANRAIIEFKNVPLSKYSGAFTTNKGFLSDDIYLQDNNYYQVYSYVIKSDQRFDDYANIVRKTVHPAGMAMFGQFQITNEIDAAASIEALVKFFSERLIDSVDTLESVAKLVIKTVADSVGANQFMSWELTKPLEDTSNSTDEILKQPIKGFSDSQTTADNISDISINKAINNEVVPNDGNIIEDPNLVYALGYFYQDYSEGLTYDNTGLDINFGKYLYNSVGATDTGALTATQDAYALDYFAEEYCEGLILATGSVTATQDAYASGYFAEEYCEGLIVTGAEKIVYKVLTDTVTTVSNISVSYQPVRDFSSSVQIEDSIEITPTEIASSSASVNDTSEINANKALEDSINISESGLIDMNDYSLSYFSETYVEKMYNL